MGDPAAAAATVLFLLTVLAIYFVPSLVAFGRHHHQATAILVVNLFLGWTFLGWVAALVWSVSWVRPEPKRRTG